jgi:KDO2-lipid IV(A) lauroyltransferase
MTGVSLGYRLAHWLSTHLPPRSAFRLAERLADAQWRWSHRNRLAVHANLSMILGDSSTVSPLAVREVFRNFGRYLVEFFTIHHTLRPELDVQGYEHLLTAHERRRGAILLTGHLGNWELGAVVIRRMGFPVAVVALTHEDPWMDRLFTGQRQRCRLDVIPLGRDAARCSLQHLRRGSLLGMLGDREFSGNGLPVLVCERTLTLPRGPALLSLRSQAPLVPTFLIREGLWRFRLCFEPPIWPAQRSKGNTTEASVRTLVERFAVVFERYLKTFPEQWLIFQSAAKAG